MTNDQKRILHSIKSKDAIFSVGLYFGFIKKNNFHLSLEGAEFLSKKDKTSNFKELILNEKGEKSILYGNDILLENVVKFSKDPKEDDFLLVKNVHDEIIACAKMLKNNKDLNNLNPRTKIALNLIDRGYYLRRIQ
ncbi:MAG: hypothetical protein ACFFD7_01655 [Candidatus Thorarchaeota archaeon]